MVLKPLYLYVKWQSNTYVKHLCVWIVYEYFSQAELKYNLTNNCLQFKNSYSKFLKKKKFQIFLEFTKLVCSFSWQFSFFFLASSRYFAYSKFLAYKLTQIYFIKKLKFNAHPERQSKEIWLCKLPHAALPLPWVRERDRATTRYDRFFWDA